MADQAETVFDTPATPETEILKSDEASVQKDEVADLLSTIRAEDGRQKYTTVDQALKALLHSQEHIKRLEKEQAETKAEMEKRMAAEELLERIESARQATETPSKPDVDGIDISKVVASEMAKLEQAKQKQGNILKADAAMKEAYGETATTVFAEKLSELGLSKEYAMNLAANSPTAFAKLMGVSEKKAQTTETRSSINTEALSNVKKQPERPKVPEWSSTKELISVWNAYKPQP